MKYIYGPVTSRRLGQSLGISITPYKICNFDCVYCQLGKTIDKVGERKEYLNVREVIDEFKSWLQNNAASIASLNYITLSGSGEPTLNIKIGEFILELKKLTTVPIALITNASLLHDPQVRSNIIAADLIVPSLDAVTQHVFEKVDRPYQDIKIENIIHGLLALKKEFSGKIWLEVMLVSGINDDLRQIKKLREAIDKISPDKIQLNSPVRTTTEAGISAVKKTKLGKIKLILGDKCEII